MIVDLLALCRRCSLGPPANSAEDVECKVRRAACRERYEQGDIGRPQRAVWWQITRLPGRECRRAASGTAQCDRSALCGLRLECARHRAAALWSAVALLPMLSWRKVIARSLSQLLLRLFGFPVRVRGLEHLPRDKAVCLWSIMPAISIPWCWSQCCRPRSVCGQAELAEQFFARILFRRLGPSLSNASTHSAASKTPIVCDKPYVQGRSMLFFPEGTFGVRLGCGPFAWAPSWWRRRPACPWCRWHHRYPLHLARGQWFPRRGTVR